jgi:chromosome partitioning protein
MDPVPIELERGILMPYVIAICHQKGGVAKTTTTLGLGASFVGLQTRTLMVDLDPQGNLTSSIGLDSDEMKYSIAEALLGEVDLTAVRMETSVPGLDIVPSSQSMLTIGRQLYQVPEYEYQLRRVLRPPATQDYQVILLDCPPSVGPITMNALTAADLLVIPTQCEFFSIQALTDMFELIRLIRNRTNPALAYRLLVTMFDRRGSFHTRMLEQMRTYFNSGLLNTTIGFDTKLREAQLAGTPVTIHAPHSRGTLQYRQLAEELIAYVTKQPQIQTA